MKHFYSANTDIQAAYEKCLLFDKAHNALVKIVCDDELHSIEANELIDSLLAKANEYNKKRSELEQKYFAEERDADLLRWYQQSPNDIMFTMNPAKLARVKELMARC